MVKDLFNIPNIKCLLSCFLPFCCYLLCISSLYLYLSDGLYLLFRVRFFLEDKRIGKQLPGDKQDGLICI